MIFLFSLFIIYNYNHIADNTMQKRENKIHSLLSSFKCYFSINNALTKRSSIKKQQQQQQQWIMERTLFIKKRYRIESWKKERKKKRWIIEFNGQWSIIVIIIDHHSRYYYYYYRFTHVDEWWQKLNNLGQAFSAKKNENLTNKH